jgi:hypothetical protein
MDEDLETEEQSAELPAEAMDLQALAGANPTLAPFMSKYFGAMEKESTALQQQAANRQKQFEAAEAAIREKRFGAPTTSEQLFALGAALLAPRRYTGFAGTLDKIAPVFGRMDQLQRSAEAQRADALEKLRREYLLGADESAVAAAAARREGLAKILPSVVTATKPRVARPVGVQKVGDKVVAVSQEPDTGEFTQTVLGDIPEPVKSPVQVSGATSGGQPVFRVGERFQLADGTPVTRFDPKQGKTREPSATELREIIKTEDLVNGRLSGIRAVQDALGLNQQAYDGSIAGVRVKLGQLFSSDDPTYVASEQLENLVKSGALANLKATFGGNPTEGERKALMDLQANLGKPRAVREKLLRRLLEEMQIGLKDQTSRLDRLKGGEYGRYQQPSPAPRGGGRVIRYDKNGNRI